MNSYSVHHSYVLDNTSNAIKLFYIDTNKPYSIMSIDLNDTHSNATTGLINTKQFNYPLTVFPCFPDDIIIFQA